TNVAIVEINIYAGINLCAANIDASIQINAAAVEIRTHIGANINAGVADIDVSIGCQIDLTAGQGAADAYINIRAHSARIDLCDAPQIHSIAAQIDPCVSAQIDATAAAQISANL